MLVALSSVEQTVVNLKVKLAEMYVVTFGVTLGYPGWFLLAKQNVGQEQFKKY